MSHSFQRKLLFLGAASAAVLLAGAAAAQTEAPSTQTAQADAAAEVASVEAVVVTGSRLGTTAGFNAPTPVTVVGAEQTLQRAPSSIGELLVEIPTFRNSQSPNVVTNGTLSGSQTLLDLRGLGSTRTLVLVNGRRHVPVNANATFDVNLLPSSLVERTEVVTGGASAAYGSDAVAGVVNFILKDKLEGFTGNVQYGISQQRDNIEQLISLGWGHAFAGGRGHFIIGGDYGENRGVGSLYERDWGRKEPGALTLQNSRAAGLPANIVGNNVELSANTPGGIIVGGPLGGTAFDVNGNPYAFNFGAVRGATEQIGSSNYGQNEYSTLSLRPPYQRGGALARAEFEITPTISAFGELHYGSLQYQGLGGTCCNSYTYVIGRDNAFLPAATRAAMVANNLQTISVGRRNTEYTGLQGANRLETVQGAVGLEGTLGGWKWDVSYTRGVSDVNVTQLTNPKVADIQHAANAVRDASGAIVCGPVSSDPYFLSQPAATRAVLTANLSAGCVPFNVFGYSQPQTDSLDYFLSHNNQALDIRQQTAGANIAGEPFTLPAGPVSLAVGAEWRKDSLAAYGCPDCATGKLQNQNFPSYSGEITVKEAYAEVGVPLLKDVTFAKSLDLNGAVRRTDYSTSGSVTTWKVGATWEPVDFLRFRATRSRDIRAPNIAELYNPGSNGRANLTNKLTGASSIISSTTAGNPNLTPEIADTFTAGVVFSPTWTWAAGFRASVDYYQIEIKDVIGSVSAQDILDRYLLQGLTEYRPFIVFDNSALGVSSVNATQLNLNAQKSDGIDIEVAYRVPLESWNVPGRLNLRALGSWADDLRTIQTLSTGAIQDVDTAGQSVPTWQWNLNAAYAIGRLTTALNVRTTSKIKYSTTLKGPDDPNYDPASNNSINRNLWPVAVNTSLSAAYDVIPDEGGRKLQVFGVIDNILDKDPPAIATVILAGNPYDVVGRSFKLGVRFAY